MAAIRRLSPEELRRRAELLPVRMPGGTLSRRTMLRAEAGWKAFEARAPRRKPAASVLRGLASDDAGRTRVAGRRRTR